MSNPEGVKEGAITDKAKATQAGSDGGWVHVKPLRARHVTPTKIVSTDCESSWSMADKQILNPKEWGKTNELWKGSLRDWPNPDHGQWKTGQMPTWKSSNYKRWPLKRIPRYDRRGVEVSL